MTTPVSTDDGVPGRGWRVVPLLWSLGLGVLLLGPALGTGYVLSYDMVWVPDLALRPDLLGVGSALPRAVPSDAVVAVLDQVVPGWVLQKVVLLAPLVAGGLGVARLLDGVGLAGRLTAISVYQWSPFVVERLLIGHWPVLIGYGVLPWVLLLAARWRRSGRVPPALLGVVVLGSLSVSAGLVTAAAVLVGVAGPGRAGLAGRPGASCWCWRPTRRGWCRGCCTRAPAAPTRRRPRSSRWVTRARCRRRSPP